jgi:hypothetical protein
VLSAAVTVAAFALGEIERRYENAKKRQTSLEVCLLFMSRVYDIPTHTDYCRISPLGIVLERRSNPHPLTRRERPLKVALTVI